ncbi:MAG: tetratricopeptide repeat protein [Proteobacteria bacterium]|nr:tetratricopeptide repeat protein [Pseudomonadota bacterium]
MATHLDLEEQEQLAELKAFWARWGNLITGTLTVVLLAFAGWNGWNWWQREQAAKASALFDAFDRAVVAGNAEQAGRAFGDLKDRYGRTVYAQQAGLLNAKLQADKGETAAATAALQWVSAQGDAQHADLARLRLAGLQLDAKQYDAALQTVDAIKAPSFAALAQDRRGDILAAQGKADEAAKAWRAAWDALPTEQNYRRVVEAKLDRAGVAPPLPASAAASGAQP